MTCKAASIRVSSIIKMQEESEKQQQQQKISQYRFTSAVSNSRSTWHCDALANYLLTHKTQLTYMQKLTSGKQKIQPCANLL